MKQGKAIITSRNSHRVPTTHTEPLHLIEISFLNINMPKKGHASQDICDAPAQFSFCSAWVITKEITKAISTGEPTSKHSQHNIRFMVRNNLTLVPNISLLLQISLKPSTF